MSRDMDTNCSHTHTHTHTHTHIYIWGVGGCAYVGVCRNMIRKRRKIEDKKMMLYT